MKDKQEIYDEFLNLGLDNSSEILSIYRHHKALFDLNEDLDKDSLKLILWMKSVIVLAAYKESDEDVVREEKNLTLKAYREFSNRYTYNLEEDLEYKLLIAGTGVFHFSRKQYLRAISFFREVKNWEGRETLYRDFEALSWYKFYMFWGRLLGISGALLLIAKYSLYLTKNEIFLGYYLMGYAGGLFLLMFGIISIFKSNPVANKT